MPLQLTIQGTLKKIIRRCLHADHRVQMWELRPSL